MYGDESEGIEVAATYCDRSLTWTKRRCESRNSAHARTVLPHEMDVAGVGRPQRATNAKTNV